jgi:DNA-binding response OmpR family regulator
MNEKEKPTDSIRILLVDDEVGFVNTLAKRLRKRGLDVVTALSGSDGIQEVRKQDFDVAVVDLKMEDMDGIEVLKVFRKMDPRMAVIMLTGHGSDQAAKEGIDFGAFDYLTKPCELEELLERIREACNRR